MKKELLSEIFFGVLAGLLAFAAMGLLVHFAPMAAAGLLLALLAYLSLSHAENLQAKRIAKKMGLHNK